MTELSRELKLLKKSVQKITKNNKKTKTIVSIINKKLLLHGMLGLTFVLAIVKYWLILKETILITSYTVGSFSIGVSTVLVAAMAGTILTTSILINNDTNKNEVFLNIKAPKIEDVIIESKEIKKEIITYKNLQRPISEVILLDGGKIEGKIISQSPNKILIKLPNEKTKGFNSDQIWKINIK